MIVVPLTLAGALVASLLLALVAAAETALERASDARIKALARQGDPRAKLIAGDVRQPAVFLPALTVGRVFLSSVVVATAAFLGARMYEPTAAALAGGLAGGLVVAFVQLSAGLAAAREPEQTALKLSRVVRLVSRVFAVPAFLLGLPFRVFTRFLTAVVPARPRDDLLTLVENEEAEGGVEEQEQRMIKAIIGLEDKTAREIMVPRIDIAAVDIQQTIEEAAALVNERGFSRVPVYRETIDDIVGVIYAKDLLRAMANGGRHRDLASLLRPPEFIPESVRLDTLLTQLRSKRVHMAIVVDEYGGTAGLVTIEDLLEEIVGEIEDEYDVVRPGMEIISEDEVVLDASESTDVLERLFDFRVESEDFDTVGGFIINSLGRLPSVGDEVTVGPLTLKVLTMSGRRVRRLRIKRERALEREGVASR